MDGVVCGYEKAFGIPHLQTIRGRWEQDFSVRGRKNGVVILSDVLSWTSNRPRMTLSISSYRGGERNWAWAISDQFTTNRKSLHHQRGTDPLKLSSYRVYFQGRPLQRERSWWRECPNWLKWSGHQELLMLLVMQTTALLTSWDNLGSQSLSRMLRKYGRTLWIQNRQGLFGFLAIIPRKPVWTGAITWIRS